QPERHASYTPLFQVMLVLQNTPMDALDLPGLSIQAVDSDNVTAKFDLTLSLTESRDGLHGCFEYSTDLFDASTVARLAQHLTHLLQAIVTDPSGPVGELPMLAAAERDQLIHAFNATATVYPAIQADTQTLHQLFEAQVARTPEQTAVIFEGVSLSYAQLNAQANRLARHLRHLGVGPDTLVGLCAERSLAMIVALYGILKAGGAYVPLDPSYPSERLAMILEDAKPVVVLTEQHLQDRMPTLTGMPVFCLDRDASVLATYAAGNLANQTQPAHLAYVIYTSGSTGKPKGVGIEHRGIVNRLQWMQEAYRLTAADRVLQKTPYSFDVSVWEFFWPLLEGATLVVARPGGHQDVAYLADVIDAQGITTLHFVPPMLEVFLNEAKAEVGASLRQVVCSGQALPLELQERFFAQWDHVALHNLYGPTEASVDVTAWTCRRDSGLGSVPIGHPIANIQIHILDDAFNPVPVGVVGHLYIAGIGLARGYINRPELTAQTFVPNPFSGTPGARMYRSGDLARYLPDGTIEYLGRSDHQVKIRGLRIELGEIESTLAAQEAVRDVVVLAREDSVGDQRLVAYLVAHAGQGVPEASQLRTILLQTLPEYMVPSYFVELDQLPLTANGKVDRKALPAPDMAPSEAAYVAPRTPTEQIMASLWMELLKLDRVGIHDDFFALGGHSLLATQLVSRLRRSELQVELPLRALFEAPTIAALMLKIAGAEAATHAATARIVPVNRHGRLPLSFAQSRLWFLDQLELNETFYNMPSATRLTGRLDVA
ncbi:non-ribosomal peptide synthetase, partial [Dyella sp. S184]|uniref:non-ribosomal peptide synthetase n=1 Tax=Dyella sp. S184 TaxID=1641862 RepID=UPI001C20C28F